MRPDIAAIRARADAATKGDWHVRQPHTGDKVLRILGPDGLTLDFDDVDPNRQLDDARFIAAARADVPALCDRVEALEAALREIAERSFTGGVVGTFQAQATILRKIEERARAALEGGP